MFKWFRKKWLNQGRVAELLEKEEMDLDRLNAMMLEFKESFAYKIILTALEDYKDEKIKEIAERVSPGKEGYGRIVAQKMAFVSFPDFWKNFVNDLIWFEETEKKLAPSLDKYL